MKENISMTKYFDSGLYEQLFYKKHYNINLSSAYEDIKYNENLLTKHYKDDLEYTDEYDLRDQVREIFENNLSNYSSVYFEPLIFDEKIALECSLTPFSYQGINLLALSGGGMDLSPRLDAYQVLTHKTIDKNSKFLSTSKKYFEDVMSKDIVDRMHQILKI